LHRRVYAGELTTFGIFDAVSDWRVFWVPERLYVDGVRKSVLPGWVDLAAKERAVGIRGGDPIFLSPDYRVDPGLSRYGRSNRFRALTAETKRNYATDIVMLLDALSARGKRWFEATADDLGDYEYYRRFDTENPTRIGGSKWDRERAAFLHLYAWAKTVPMIAVNPVDLMPGSGRAKDTRPVNAHWLTPRTWRTWLAVGVHGHGADGVPEPGWVGRLEDRNAAFVRLTTSSGLRRTEAGSLLTFEVPSRRLDGGRYVVGRVAAEVTRSKVTRTFYAAEGAIGEIEAYVESSRAWAVRQAQQRGLYERVAGMRLVTDVTRGPKPKVRWRESGGAEGEQRLDDLTWQERTRLYTEGPEGPEPLWLWLNERGMPFRPHSWENVFREANERCGRVLIPRQLAGVDPHQQFAPYATPHSARHSFALYMLVVLEEVMDRRYGLSPEERRDYRMLYGDPWFMVQGLLGHARRETTVRHYLAPVRKLQLSHLLSTVEEPIGAGDVDLDMLFTRVARQAVGIQDIEARMGTGR
jgi:site-specific recombinase XerD